MTKPNEMCECERVRVRELKGSQCQFSILNLYTNVDADTYAHLDRTK